MRIQKFLSEIGYCSRSQAEKLIREGSITVNGRRANLGDKVSEKDNVSVEGSKISGQRPKRKILAFHKPTGVDCTLSPSPWRKTLRDIDFGQDRVFPIGRLDKDANGLLLLTNDGELGNRLAHPSRDHEEEYRLVIREALTSEIMEYFRNGEGLDNQMAKPLSVEKAAGNVLNIILHDGRSKHIRRMCRAAGVHMHDLQRIRIGSIELGALQAGCWRVLSKEEFGCLADTGRHGRRRVVQPRR